MGNSNTANIIEHTADETAPTILITILSHNVQSPYLAFLDETADSNHVTNENVKEEFESFVQNIYLLNCNRTEADKNNYKINYKIVNFHLL